MSRPAAPTGATTAADPRGASHPAQRRTLAVLVVAQILGTIGLGVAPSIGILLAGEVTDSEAWAGLARTSSTLGAALMGVPLGMMAARRGRRVALTVGWWIAGLGAALLVLAAQWDLVVPLFLGLLLTGAGTAASLQARFAATDLASPATRARSLSLVVWMGAIGNVLGPNLGVPGQAIGAATGLSVYSAAFLIAAVGSVVAGAVVLVLLRPDPLLLLARDSAAPDLTVRSARPASRRQRLRDMAREFRVNRRARTALVAILTSQTVMVALMTMTPVHVQHEGGSVTIVGITISLHVAGMYGLSPVVGILIDRVGHRAAVVAGIVLFAASLALAVLASGAMAGVMASLILLGLGWSFMNVGGSALFGAAVSDRARASAQGGADALSNLCGAVASFASGPIMAVSSFSVLGMIGAVLLVPVLVLALGSGPWREDRAPAS